MSQTEWTEEQRARRRLTINRWKREQTIWHKVNELAQLFDTEVYLEIQHHGDEVKLIYHSHPEADGPLLTWGEIKRRGYPKPVLHCPSNMPPVERHVSDVIDVSDKDQDVDHVEDGAEDEIDAMFEEYLDDNGALFSVQPGRVGATAVHSAAASLDPPRPRASQNPPVRKDAMSMQNAAEPIDMPGHLMTGLSHGVQRTTNPKGQSVAVQGRSNPRDTQGFAIATSPTSSCQPTTAQYEARRRGGTDGTANRPGTVIQPRKDVAPRAVGVTAKAPRKISVFSHDAGPYPESPPCPSRLLTPSPSPRANPPVYDPRRLVYSGQARRNGVGKAPRGEQPGHVTVRTAGVQKVPGGRMMMPRARRSGRARG